MNNFDDLPGIYRFFAGGDRSVRGFAYNSLSPEEEVLQTDGTTELQKTGGRYLLVGSVEMARDLPHDLAAAVFFDVGNAFNRFGDPMEYSVGVGVRYRLPVVSLGLDIAQPLSNAAADRACTSTSRPSYEAATQNTAGARRDCWCWCHRWCCSWWSPLKPACRWLQAGWATWASSR